MTRAMSEPGQRLLISEGGRGPIWLTERQASRIGFTEAQIAAAKAAALLSTTEGKGLGSVAGASRDAAPDREPAGGAG